MLHTLRERSRKVERKKGQRYSNEFRRQAFERMKSCDNLLGLSRELGIPRRLLYNWRDRFEETDPPHTQSRELILRKQITKLKRLLANKTLEVVAVEGVAEHADLRACTTCSSQQLSDAQRHSLGIVFGLDAIPAAFLAEMLAEELIPNGIEDAHAQRIPLHFDKSPDLSGWQP